jgi:tRNA threonylcarbamoyladenosine biosynthesis protein TsaE
MGALSEAFWEYHSDSPENTLALGSRIARAWDGGLVLALSGPLGAGKTLLVKGIAHDNAGGDREVTSPTFTLVQEYSGRLRIYHLDVYRLVRSDDPLLAGLDEMIRPDSAVIIEWADRVRPALPLDTLWIDIDVQGDRARQFRFRGVSMLARKTLQRLASGAT